MLQIVLKDVKMTPGYMHRVVWCPFLPDEDDCDEDYSTLMVLTHGNKGKAK